VARGRAPGGARDAAPGRAPRRHLVPLARGPDRQAVPARPRARLHVPARLPGLRLRERAGAAGNRATARSPDGGRDRRQSARRVSAAACRREGQGDRVVATADWFATETVAAPVERPRPQPRRRAAAPRTRRRAKGRRLRGGIFWISAFAILLAGVV